ncbi:MAG TPA: tetratricopeptide repeat protein [Phaeodactylibacter sp.]|nr:tetratricopeptide repeat protein [Phaeodactylibacter sp.]
MKKSTLPLLLSLLFILAACSSERKAQRSAIQIKEATVDEDPTADNVQTLMQLYQEYRAIYPEDNSFNARYLYREAGLHYRMNQYGQAAELLQATLRNYPDAEVSPQAAYMLGAIYEEKLRQSEPALTIFQAMQKAFPEDSLSAKALQRLPDGIEPAEDRLAKLRQSIFSDSIQRINYRRADAYLSSAELYALLLPNAATSPDVLYQAGEIARAVRNHELALRLYATLYERYPKHENAPKALFMQAFTYDDNLKQFDKAREAYELFLQKYPNDDFADDAQVLLDNLGKKDEEIIDNLTGKSKSDTE